MVTVEVNGRQYNVREYMKWSEWDALCDADDFGVRIIFENLLDGVGAPYPTMEAMRAAVPVPDVKGIRKEIYRLNGLEDVDPLASGNGSSED